MAANKFATLIHRKTNRITLVLVYAFLEWTLIFFILLNSLFSYLILQFADFFGLKRPCLFCSRLDHFFDPSRKSSSSYRDLLCDDHAAEISRLGFCYSHRRVSESRDLCQDCSSSDEFSKDFACFPWMDHKVVEHGEADLIKCCPCCGASVKKRVLSPCVLIEPDWGILDFVRKGKPIEEDIDEGIQIPAEQIGPDSSVHEEENADSVVDLNDTQKGDSMREEETEEKFPSEHEQRKQEENREIQIVPEVPEKEEEEEVNGNDEDEFSCFISSFDCNKEIVPENKEESKADLVMEVELAQKVVAAESCMDKPTEIVASKHLEFYIDGQDCHLIPVEFYKPGDEVQEISDSNGDVILDFVVEHRKFSEETVTFVSSDEPKHERERLAVIEEAEEDFDSNDDHQVQGSSDDLLQAQNDEETDAEISIGTEIPDHEQIEDVPCHENTAEEDDHLVSDQVEDMLEFRTVTIETRKPVISTGVQFEEEKVPETPGSVDSLHKTVFLLDRKESGTEDSLDSVSVTSEIECPDGELTIEKLKSALREERKALNALYAELEEERSASAVAANQTMAMINRLQEEKAAMHMEALQYQRMMEEQSEYDQEALELLNELMVKREKEKTELEKELEMYRKRVEEYEEKEKTGMLRRRRDSTGSCTNTEDFDGLSSSVDTNQEIREDEKDKDKDKNGDFDDNDDGVIEHKNTPVDAVLCLEESLADFEEERLSILEQLKVLEEKLSKLNEEEGSEDGIFMDVKQIENGNGHMRENGHFLHTKALRSKRLLPLFDAAETETENGLSNGGHHENGIGHSENNRIAIEEEIEELYERLQALEADREFLRHCVGSLRKGDKGVYLLQEILQHLRDLRSVELRVRNAGDIAL